MKTKQAYLLLVTYLILTPSLYSCTSKSKAEIEQSFEQVLALYPTKNLTDFYEMEGYRDEEFAKDDKGVWVLNSSMSVSQSEESGLVTEEMILRMNRNTKKATGHFYTFTTWNDLKKPVEKREYAVTFDTNNFHLPEDVHDEKIKEKVENFQFFVQYGNFDQLETYKNSKKMYNPEVPMYELEYQLSNQDPNVQDLRKRYDIPTDKTPTLLLKGRGDLKGTSVGYKQLEFTFNKKSDIFFTDSIDFQPQSPEDRMNKFVY